MIEGNRVSKPSNSGTATLFKNPVLERLSRTHVLVPISLFGVFSIFLIYWGIAEKGFVWYLVIPVFVAGWLAFSLVEYLVHRYVFHMSAETPARANIQYKFHGVHHDFPKDKERLAMPPVVSVTITAILFLLFRLIMGNAVYAFLPGFLIGYAGYLGVHFIVHAWQPPKNFFKYLWINHGIHHYKDHERAFGVSSPLWDYIFRTMPRKS